MKKNILFTVLMIFLLTGCGKANQVRFEAVSDSTYSGREEWGYSYVQEEGSILLTVYRGTKNTGGYGISVESVVGDEKHIDVTVVEENPDSEPGAVVTEALTYPCCTVRIFINPQEISVRNQRGDEYPYLLQN